MGHSSLSSSSDSERRSRSSPTEFQYSEVVDIMLNINQNISTEDLAQEISQTSLLQPLSSLVLVNHTFE